MKKIIKLLLVIVSFLLLTGCNISKEQYVITLEYNNGDMSKEVLWTKGNGFKIDEDVKYDGYDLEGWYLDEECTLPLTDDYIVNSNLTLYAKWEVAKHSVCFYNGQELIKEIIVEHNKTIEDNITPIKLGYTFLYWTTDVDGNSRFSLLTKITDDINLYAKYKLTQYEVICDLQNSDFNSKEELYTSFFTDFYDFLLNKTDVDFQKLNITDLYDFLLICKDWNAYNKNSFYGVGDKFAKYYLTIEVGGNLENQPETTFIGYCYKNNMYQEFIPFLMTFFAYWRTDEGYTGSSSDPNNTGNDFFASAWASLVDTCKFFYFTSETLNDTYPWFNSERVKYALDNIPGVAANIIKYYGDIENPVILDVPQREGYEFIGWYNENDEKIEIVYNESILYAKWKKLDN